MKNLALHMRISTLTPHDGEVDSRRAAGTALASAWSKLRKVPEIVVCAQEVAVALWSAVPPDNLATQVEAAVQEHSSSFLASDRPLEIGICAAVAVSKMVEMSPHVDGYSATDLFVTALWSALSFQAPLEDAKREAMRSEILEAARVRAIEASDLSRKRTEVIDFGVLNVEQQHEDEGETKIDRVEVSSCRLYIAHQRKKFSHRLLGGWLAQRGEQRAKPDQAFAHFLKPATYQDNFSVSLWRLIALQC